MSSREIDLSADSGEKATHAADYLTADGQFRGTTYAVIPQEKGQEDTAGRARSFTLLA